MICWQCWGQSTEQSSKIFSKMRLPLQTHLHLLPVPVLCKKVHFCKPKGFDSILSCSCLERQVYLEVYVLCGCPDFTHISSFRLFKKMKLAKKIVLVFSQGFDFPCSLNMRTVNVRDKLVTVYKLSIKHEHSNFTLRNHRCLEPTKTTVIPQQAKIMLQTWQLYVSQAETYLKAAVI